MSLIPSAPQSVPDHRNKSGRIAMHASIRAINAGMAAAMRNPFGPPSASPAGSPKIDHCGSQPEGEDSDPGNRTLLEWCGHVAILAGVMASRTTSAIRAARQTTCPNRRRGRTLQRVFYRSNKTDLERDGKVIEDGAIAAFCLETSPVAQKVGRSAKQEKCTTVRWNVGTPNEAKRKATAQLFLEIKLRPLFPRPTRAPALTGALQFRACARIKRTKKDRRYRELTRDLRWNCRTNRIGRTNRKGVFRHFRFAGEDQGWTGMGGNMQVSEAVRIADLPQMSVRLMTITGFLCALCFTGSPLHGDDTAKKSQDRAGKF